LIGRESLDMARRDMPPVRASVPNLAPMVDVVMVILIFFMLGTSFAISEGMLPTQLPSQIGPGGEAAVAIVPEIRVTLLEGRDPAKPRIMVMEEALAEGAVADLTDLRIAKREAGADESAPVLIGAAPDVQYQHVISAMDACLAAGFENILFCVGRTIAPSRPSP